MIYAHKPQRSGRSITANTNNPPQDPPPPPNKDILPIEPVVEQTPEPITQPVVESTIPKIIKAPTIKAPTIKAPTIKAPTIKAPTIKAPKTKKFAFLHNIIAKIKIFFKRGK